jgi:arylsulfatase A-like enzyme
LTGQHTPNHGVIVNNAVLFRPGMTLATQLHGKGYYTLLAGKYLNRYDLVAPAIPPGWDRFHAFSEGGYYDYELWSNGRRRIYGHGPNAYSTDVVARLAVNAMASAPPSRPIFAWIAPFAAHAPLLAAPRHRAESRCDEIAPWKPANYMERDVSDKPYYVRQRERRNLDGAPLGNECRALLAVDDLVANVRNELRRQRRLDNTLLVLTGDNGMNYGAHRIPGDKKTPYATQIPFYVSWPARMGTVRRTVAERLQNIDFAPTICHLIGCRLGPYPGGQQRPDGLSFARVLLGIATSVDRDAVYLNMPAKGTWVPRWRGIATTLQSRLAHRGCTDADRGRCRWAFVLYETGERELYEQSHGPCWKWSPGQPGDPCWLRNLAGRPRFAAIEHALLARLLELERQELRRPPRWG